MRSRAGYRRFCKGVDFLRAAGFIEKSYQETKRELWHLDGAEVTIDEWPFIDPFVEVEASSEELVKRVSANLGLDLAIAVFDAADVFYTAKYGLSKDRVNKHTPKIVFEMENPFL
ncbi:MAG: hypothetical protein ACOCXP_00360 [Candidatus Dojkabacteria bacterium]